MKTIVGGLLTGLLFYGALGFLETRHIEIGELASALLAAACGFVGFWIAHNLPRRTER